MAGRRPANSVTILQRRLSQAESAPADPMELAGIHDELARIERKWLMQFAQGSERRKPGDRDKLDAWFGRLHRLIEASLRTRHDDASEALLRATLEKIGSRERRA